jgi:hypothetical protein
MSGALRHPLPLRERVASPRKAGEPGEGSSFDVPLTRTLVVVVGDRVNALKARVHPLPQGERVSELAARVEKTWSND